MSYGPAYYEHEMNAVREQRDKLRKALIGLVGSDDKVELEAMEAVTRMMTAPDKDKTAMINAIDAILETTP